MADDKKDFEFLLSQFLDGQLNPREAAELQDELRKDPSLAQQLRQYQALDKHLGELAVPELTELDYEAQRSAIMSSLERKVLLEARRPKIILLRPAFWGAAAAAAAVVLAVSLAWKGLFTSGPNTPNTFVEQVAVRVLPEGPAAHGQAVVKMVAARITSPEPEVAPPAPLPSLNQAPPGTVMVSITPPAEVPDGDAVPGEIDFPI